MLKSRPIVGNLSLAGSVKMELIAGLLYDKKHEVEIISQGEVVEWHCELYPSFRDPAPFNSHVPIYYASALPIRFLNGLWSSNRTLNLFKLRHQSSPFDLVIIYNLKRPQVASADYAIRCLGLPVVFEYEDDAFVDLAGRSAPGNGLVRRLAGCNASGILSTVSGCIGASPHLLSQLPQDLPKLLLRGVVGCDLVETSERMRDNKNNWVLFSGTFHKVKGIEQLIKAWQLLQQSGWELHITGHGGLAANLEEMARGVRGVVFHGFVSRQELVHLMCSSKICINPHDVSETPGNVFAFKIIEYLAAGAHVISTPMGLLEAGIEQGVSYIQNNDPATIATALRQAILSASWRRTAVPYVLDTYGLGSISRALDEFLQQATEHHRSIKNY